MPEELTVLYFCVSLGILLLCMVLFEILCQIVNRIGVRVRIGEIGGVAHWLMEIGSIGSSRQLRHPGTRHRVDIHKAISPDGCETLHIQLDGDRFTQVEFRAAQDALRQEGIAYRLIHGSKGTGSGLVVDCGSDVKAVTAALRALFVNAWGFSFDTVLRMSAKGYVRFMTRARFRGHS